MSPRDTIKTVVTALKLADRASGVTTAQLAGECGISVPSARNILIKLESLGELTSGTGDVPKIQSPGRAPVVWRKVVDSQDT